MEKKDLTFFGFGLLTLIGITLVSVNLYTLNCPIYNATISLPQNVVTWQQIGLNCANGGNAGSVTLVAGQEIIGGNILANGGAGGNCTINKTAFEQSMKVTVNQTGIKPSCIGVNLLGVALLVIGILFFIWTGAERIRSKNTIQKSKETQNSSEEDE